MTVSSALILSVGVTVLLTGLTVAHAVLHYYLGGFYSAIITVFLCCMAVCGIVFIIEELDGPPYFRDDIFSFGSRRRKRHRAAYGGRR